MTDMHNQQINSFLRELRQIFALKYSLYFFTAWFFLWGIGIIILRMIWGTSRVSLLWGAVLLVPLLALASIFSAKKLPEASSVRAFLDYKNECGGMLMAEEEYHLGKWRQQLKPVKNPQFQWSGGETWKFFGMALVFWTASFFAPQTYLTTKTSHPLEIGDEVKKIADQIKILKEEEIIEQEQAKVIDEKLKQIKEEAKGEDPVEALETLDHLENMVDKASKEAKVKAVQEMEELTQAETLAKSLDEESETMKPEVESQAMAELSNMVDQATKKQKRLRKKMSKKNLEACAKRSLSKEQLKEILEALRKRKTEINKQMAKLQKAGMMSKKSMGECKKAGQCNSNGLAKFLNKHAKTKTVKGAMRTWKRGQKPGTGGVNRGPGKAAMDFWDTETDDKGAKFKDQILPPSQVADLKNSKVFWAGLVAPPEKTTVSETSSGNLSNSPDGKGAAFDQVVLPVHQDIVNRFYKRK